MLKQRILSAIVLIAIVLCALFFFSPFYFALSLGVVVSLGVWEWTQFARIKQPILRLCCTVLAGVFLFLWLYSAEAYLQVGRVFETHLQGMLFSSVIWNIIALGLVVTYPSSAKIWSKNVVLQIFFAFFTLVPFLGAVLRLRLDNYFSDPYHGLFLLLYVFILVWATDSGAYFAGRAFGKHKLAPKVSPGKTWQGVFGGLFTAVILAFIFIQLSGESLLNTRNLSGFIAVSVATVAVSVLGDLTESMFKREAGIKDSSQLIPGHGGILDRIDSLTFAVPFFTYFYFFVL